jgi:hypothetical protein
MPSLFIYRVNRTTTKNGSFRSSRKLKSLSSKKPESARTTRIFIPFANNANASFRNSTTRRLELQLPLRSHACRTKCASANGQLYVQALDQMEPTPIPETKDGSDPCFSPDGESIAFSTNTQLKSVSLTGITPLYRLTWKRRSRMPPIPKIIEGPEYLRMGTGWHTPPPSLENVSYTCVHSPILKKQNTKSQQTAETAHYGRPMEGNCFIEKMVKLLESQ